MSETFEEYQSTRFGVVDVNPESTLTFPNGIIQLEGFHECTRYHLFHEEGGNKIIRYLQSLDDPDLSFTLIDPSFLNIDYEIALNDQESELLGLESKEDEVVIMLMVYRTIKVEGEDVKQDEEIRAQTQSPLIINPRKRLGMQKVGLRSRLVFTNFDEE
jgi:flagellar assembly factor FliW